MPALYIIEDSTTSTGSGAVSTISGGGTSTVVLTVPHTINGGDTLSITIEDAFNPGAAGAYAISLGGDVTGSSTGLVFPGAGVAYPDGALLSFVGTLYVFAGGHAFGVPSPAAAAAVEAVDHAVVSASPGTVPSTNAVPGTLVVVYNNPTIYVVGADGQLHGFATPGQFIRDGYDPADVITVPESRPHHAGIDGRCRRCGSQRPGHGVERSSCEVVRHLLRAGRGKSFRGPQPRRPQERQGRR